MKAEETKIGPNTMPVSKGMDIKCLYNGTVITRVKIQ